jgi:hypothetical protein
LLLCQWESLPHHGADHCPVGGALLLDLGLKLSGREQRGFRQTSRVIIFSLACGRCPRSDVSSIGRTARSCYKERERAVYRAIFAYGVAGLDNALLQPLAGASATKGCYEFMPFIAPVKVVGGTR